MKADSWLGKIGKVCVNALYGRKCGQCCAIDGVTGGAAKSPEDAMATARPKTKRQVIAEFDRLMVDCQNEYLIGLRDLQLEHCRHQVALCVWREKQLAGALDDELDSEETIRELVCPALKGVSVT